MDQRYSLNELRKHTESNMGIYGGTRITDTNAATPNSGYEFFAIQAEEDTVIDTVVGNLDLDGAAITAEGIRYGRWSSIKLTSGKVIAYQRLV